MNANQSRRLAKAEALAKPLEAATPLTTRQVVVMPWDDTPVAGPDEFLIIFPVVYPQHDVGRDRDCRCAECVGETGLTFEAITARRGWFT